MTPYGTTRTCLATSLFAEKSYHRRTGTEGDHRCTPQWRRGATRNRRKNVMGKVAIAVVLTAVVASPALAQSFDPHIGSGNLSTTVDSAGIYLPPAPSGVCEVRRVQFSDAFGWRVRDVLVCCTQGRCTSRLTY